MLPKKLDRASTSPSTVVTVKSGAACPISGPTLSDGIEMGSGTGVAVGTGVEPPLMEGSGVPVGGEVIAEPETVGSVSPVLPVSPQAARNTPSRQVEMNRPAFGSMLKPVPLSASFKGQCGMSHENAASGPGEWPLNGHFCYSILHTRFRWRLKRNLMMCHPGSRFC